jgi:hypothetical protein
MVYRRTRVSRSTFRKLPTLARFNLAADNAGPYAKTSAAVHQGSSADGTSTLTTIADKTAAVVRMQEGFAYTDA